MLEHTFVHIQNIGLKTERRLWERGIHTWRQFLDHDQPIFSPARDEYIREEVESSIAHMGDIRYFNNRLPSSEMWRVFGAFKDRAVYLDIETSGLYQDADEITVIGLYDGRTVQSFVNGKNLEDFEIAIASYDLVITFNGSRFDLPFIRRWFRHITLPPAHITNRESVGKVSRKQVEDIARLKLPDLNTENLASAVRTIEGAARSMGLDVEGAGE